MFRLCNITALCCCLAATALAQVCNQNAGAPVEMQVRLTFADNTTLGDPQYTGHSAEDESSQRGNTTGSDHPVNQAANMQIRVRLQDPSGSNLREASPNSEGLVVFHTCSLLVYRVSVYGADIEDTAVDDLQPGRGDRVTTIVLRRKKTQSELKAANTTMVDAKRLHVPAKAQKELDKGNSALAAGDFKDARKGFEKAIELYPEFDQAYNNLGVVLMQTGEPEAGEKAFLKAVELNDHFARAYINLAKIRLSQRKYADAEDLLVKALTSDPLNAQAVFLEEEAAFFSGKMDQVIADARKLHTLEHEKYGLGHFLAGKALQSKGQIDEAAAEYKTFLKEAPDDPNATAARSAIKQIGEQQKNETRH
jgi:tetratricopeptide (TPR) repeat protein